MLLEIARPEAGLGRTGALGGAVLGVQQPVSELHWQGSCLDRLPEPLGTVVKEGLVLG